MKQQKGLGRGLDAIFSSEKIEKRIAPMGANCEIAVERIEPNPTQPRARFEDGQLAELAASIGELGVIQPITLKECGAGRYMIISGERRWRAAQMAGLSRVPAYIREVDDEQLHAMALVENLQREDLNPIEVALGMQRLVEECRLTQEQLAQRLSMKRSSVSNYLRLLRLPDEVQLALKEGLVTMGHAKAIASVEGHDEQIEMLRLCVERGLSVRDVERMAQSMVQGESQDKPQVAKEAKVVDSSFEPLSSHLEGIFPKGVSINTNSRGGGKIVISFTNMSEVQQLIAELDIERRS
ncbi:MAG: ParB/RepB/Spo0J family partition protein [Rikenellaceae bacterium]